jgi:putative transposase
VRLQRQFVYLAVILDAYSRKVVGWALDDSLQVRLTLRALEKALAERNPAPGLVHHSDRGIQYAAQEYVEGLQKYGIVASMSRPANPWDNAVCESFMKTLKQEEIYALQYTDRAALEAGITVFLEEYYNRQRLHSALGYRTPEEFEQAGRTGNHLGATVTMSFFRHEEIYRSEEERKREPRGSDSRLAPLDESPAGYSLASCSPAELASASPTEAHLVTTNFVRRQNVSER